MGPIDSHSCSCVAIARDFPVFKLEKPIYHNIPSADLSLFPAKSSDPAKKASAVASRCYEIRQMPPSCQVAAATVRKTAVARLADRYRPCTSTTCWLLVLKLSGCSVWQCFILYFFLFSCERARECFETMHVMAPMHNEKQNTNFPKRNCDVSEFISRWSRYQ